MIRLDRYTPRAARAAGLGMLLGSSALIGSSALLCGAALAQQATTTEATLPDLYVTATRLDGGSGGIAGASTTVVTAEEIERSPEQTIPGILSRVPGVQVSNMYGGVNGARSTVDLRGFGATGMSNTLVLVNGRRVDVPDQQGFDWGSIPLNSIERIEVTRGNSGAVLYGDGAVGGVINIVTKAGAGATPSARVETAFGSYGQVEGRASATMASGAHALALYGNAVRSDGYRDNNAYHQTNAVADYRYTREWGSFYLTATGSDQHLGYPGARRVDPWNGVNQLGTDRRGTDTPYDYGNQQQASATAGLTYDLLPGIELILDGGVRARKQQAGFFVSCFDYTSNVSVPGCARTPTSYIDSTLVTSSVTPRLRVDTSVLGVPWKATIGVDYYYTDYGSPRSYFEGAAPIHTYDLAQTSLAAYAMNTVTVLPSTDLSFGGRVQRTRVTATDSLNTAAPGYYVCDPVWGCYANDRPQASPLDQTQTNHAYHLGFEHRFNTMLTLFGRTAQSFRVPNVDERVGSSPYYAVGNFDLETQTSYDYEGGIRVSAGPLWMQWSVYDMYLDNEIFYSPATFTNINLDPTRRYGTEAMATFQLNEAVKLKAGVAYTRAVFREGDYAGNDVPLVSRNTASAGVVWSILDKRLVFNGDVRYVGSRRMDNDSANRQPLIPSVVLVDVKLGGEWDRYFWSVAVQNLFDEDYFDYAIASASTIGIYNAYPLAGRTFLVRAGANF
ncbi:TonB-dependent receptor [Rhodoplanes sp. TEM]|uniref:TonB-dependent receptor n=1 Tax=Rhodoplanes tepidamans TaxID=200616 RepID=A0ABT5JEW3_RHOTP|nr:MULTISPECIES: TonB-dependent receptor [Rhodoplanes]MDC7788171.1 TonB-dependent receptor [Rhodoplanes tepidamans]MDC7986520.1 TonB-dependent receptor [Rhodoplanes sp. TEM]MDQ0355139.1 iron complex outermembrane receptor protein [Rhodoplanes tepidamans]